MLHMHTGEKLVDGLGSGASFYIPNWLSKEESSEAFQRLQNEVRWRTIEARGNEMKRKKDAFCDLNVDGTYPYHGLVLHIAWLAIGEQGRRCSSVGDRDNDAQRSEGDPGRLHGRCEAGAGDGLGAVGAEVLGRAADVVAVDVLACGAAPR